MPIDFTAIDFETANSHSASACSVGLVRVRDGVVVERADWLIKPPAAHGEFLFWNVKIHGINAVDVLRAQSWEQQLPDMLAFIGSDITVAHNAGFDMGVIRGACAATVQPTPRLQYLCSVQVARKTYDLESYKLPIAAAAAGFREFNHHDAAADAEASAAIVIDAAQRHEVQGIADLAKAAGVKINHLKAQPLKL